MTIFFEEKSLTKKMNTKTLAVVTTNIFNTFSHLKKLKKSATIEMFN